MEAITVTEKTEKEDSGEVSALLLLRAAPEQADELAELIERMVSLTNEHHNPLFYGASRTADDDHLFVVFERWSSPVDVQHHLADPGYQALNREAAERGLLVAADSHLRFAPLGSGPIRGARLAALAPNAKR